MNSLGRGQPCFILINGASGSGQSAGLEAILRGVLNELGQKFEFVHVGDSAELPALARESAARARTEGGALVVVGGDGTINGALPAALAEQCLFAVVPGGTFNYFARTHGISEDPAEATRQFLMGQVVPARVALVGERPFVVNASIGLYPKALEERERAQARLGRSRLVAGATLLLTFLGKHRQLPLEIVRDGKVERRRSSTLVVANNQLQLEQVGVDEGVDGKPRHLTAIVVVASGLFSTLRMIALAALGRLGEAENASSFSFERLTVRNDRVGGRRGFKVAVDGEITWLEAPLVFRSAPKSLRLLRPALPGSATARPEESRA